MRPVEHTDCSRASRHDVPAAHTLCLVDPGTLTRRRRIPDRPARAATQRRCRALPGVRALARVGALGARAGCCQGATCHHRQRRAERRGGRRRCRPPSPRCCAAPGCRSPALGSMCARSTSMRRDDLVAVNADQSFLLASTTKLVTSLAALDLLGAEHRWRTGAFATGPVAEGRLSGDLVISGGTVGLTGHELRRWFAQMRGAGRARGQRQHRARPRRAAARARPGAGADDGDRARCPTRPSMRAPSTSASCWCR